MKNILISTATAALLAATVLTPAHGETDTMLEQKISEISQKYQVELSEIEAEGSALAADAPDYEDWEAMVGISIDTSWDTTSIVFDVPEVTFKTRDLSLHLPQFRMKSKRIVWDNPEMKMVLKVVGKYPCFRGLKQYMCEIKTKVPEWRMVRREARLDIPEVFWARTDFSMDIPEFSMNQVEVKMDLPQFRVDDVKATLGAYEGRANTLSERAEQLAAAQMAEISEVVHADLSDKRSAVSVQFDGAIAALNKAITDVEAHGANPEEIQSVDGVVNLIAELDKLRAKKAKALAAIDSHMQQLAVS
ncbi:MAG: hypothetical protein WBC68_09210 [Albidovulum sp.]